MHYRFPTMPTTIEELEQWMQAPKEVEGLEFKAAKSGYSGEKLFWITALLSGMSAVAN